MRFFSFNLELICTCEFSKKLSCNFSFLENSQVQLRINSKLNSKQYYHFRSTVKSSVNVFSRMFINFQTRQFARQLCRLDQWKCFVWGTKLWMFVKEMYHVLLTWTAALTKLKTCFRVLEAWCHCVFRKIEALKVNKFGRTYHTGTQAAKALVVRSYFSSILRVLVVDPLIHLS